MCRLLHFCVSTIHCGVDYYIFRHKKCTQRFHCPWQNLIDLFHFDMESTFCIFAPHYGHKMYLRIILHYLHTIYFRHNLVIISCSTCCLETVKTIWVCASFDFNLIIISCSTCCFVGPVKATWVCASFDSNDDD